jgi:Uma2 family endonuclease
MLAEVRPITVWEYHQMAEAGILQPQERVELMRGQLIKMAVKGTAHSSATTRTGQVLNRILGEQVTIRLQEPIQLNDYSEPEPDIAIVQVDPWDYANHHPTAEEVYWVIEVASSSLKQDCEIKAQLYAEAEIPEYWVLDVIERVLHVFRGPTPTGYQSQVRLAEDAIVATLEFGVKIAVREMLPKTQQDEPVKGDF